MKVTILYFSKTGNTHKMAEVISEGILSSLPAAEIRLMNINDESAIDTAFIEDSKAVIFGTPTYVANMCWQIKRFFDERFDCKLAGKLGAAFSTANVIQGGADVALLGVVNHMLVRGMLVYSSGTEFGLPYIHLGPVALRDSIDENAALFRIFGERLGIKIEELYKEEEN